MIGTRAVGRVGSVGSGRLKVSVKLTPFVLFTPPLRNQQH